MFFQQTQDACCPDWIVSCQNFDCSGALYDAIVRSLFTEARDPTCKTGGWWCQPDFGMKPITSTTISDAIPEAEDNARQALQWLERDGVVTELNVSAEYDGQSGICVTVAYSHPEGCEQVFNLTSGQFGWVWNG